MAVNIGFIGLGSMGEGLYNSQAQAGFAWCGQFGSQAPSPKVVRMLEQACGAELRAPGYPTELVSE
ncbi:MAG: hypothetical protein H7172_06535 [Ferruginibacter sp.]|nr:hypothetical protein [Rhodoferax sp.]